MGKKDIHVLKHLNSMATILIGIIIIMVPNVNAADFERITCFTDKIVYEPGEIVIVTVNNTTSGEIYVTDREYIDGGFATIEIKNNDGTWDPIELIAAANITTLKKLTEGDSHRYIWKTIGYNRSDTIAVPGLYRISIYNTIYTNQFEIMEKAQRR